MLVGGFAFDGGDGPCMAFELIVKANSLWSLC